MFFSTIRFIIGLGNPGIEYEGTRHNIGFEVVDCLTEKLDIKLIPGKGDYLIGWKRINQQHVGIVKPLTFMNNSGVAVRDIAESYSTSTSGLLVVVDDFNLPLGTLRLRHKGNDGGHNGLYSLIYHLHSNEFPRLRCGIAGVTMPTNKKDMAGYVLSTFDKQENEIADRMIHRASDALFVSITEGLDAAINKYNTKNV
ncbi:MAG: aminoacyl-tRNA hydrolase [Ignavibacteriae bacterium]|nr:aminoacyl-tRNA hydrolase [Ignavibacteriota bacterium]